MIKSGKIIPLIGILLAIFHQSAANNAKCQFQVIENEEFNNPYMCILNNDLIFKSSKSAIITSVDGYHIDAKSNADVSIFDSEDHHIKYFPKQLDKFFPNLAILKLDNGEISSIAQEDLKSHPKLRYFSMRRNLLTMIEADLFKFNPELVSITFSLNQIIYIHPNVFDHLSKLKTLELSHLSCINKYATDDQNSVKEVIKDVKLKCDDQIYSELKERLLNLKIQEKSLNILEFKEQLIELEEDIALSNHSKLESFQKSLSNLQEIKLLKAIEARVVEPLKNQLDELKESLRECKKA